MYRVVRDNFKRVYRFYVDDNEIGSISFDEFFSFDYSDEINVIDNFYYVYYSDIFYYLKDGVKFSVVFDIVGFVKDRIN